MKTKNWIRFGLIGIAIAAIMGCNGSDLTRSASPTALIVSTSQNLFEIDLAPGAANCNQNIGTINMQAVIKNPNSGTTNTTFEQLRITGYQVSYVRTDGGKQVPAPFTMTMDVLLIPGGAATTTNFVAFKSDAIAQAPFASLLPSNGGRDPETGKSTVSMDLIFTIFGETLAGDKVSAQTRSPLTFCYNCGGCS